MDSPVVVCDSVVDDVTLVPPCLARVAAMTTLSASGVARTTMRRLVRTRHGLPECHQVVKDRRRPLGCGVERASEDSTWTSPAPT
jgi:hypothetical protein